MTSILRHRLIFLAVACLFLLTLSVAACGGDDDDGEEPDLATATEDSSDEDDQDEPTPEDEDEDDAEQTPDGDDDEEDDGNGGSGDGIDVCGLLTPDEIASAVGITVDDGEDFSTEPFYSCTWTGTDSLDIVTSSVFQADDDELDTYYELTEGAEEVDGLGNRAQWSTDILNLLEVQTDDYVFDVSVSVSELEDEQAKEASIELAEIIIDRLP